jgi:hypothetical protein
MESRKNNSKNTKTNHYISSNERPVRPSKNGKYNLDFIDWNNEWERVNEVAIKIERGDDISDEDEKVRVTRHMNIEKEKFGIDLSIFPLVKTVDTSKECYICLKSFTKGKKIRILPCKHLFCEECLKPWLKTNYTCPTCKYKLKQFDDEESLDLNGANI